MADLEARTFLWLLLGVSMLFAWILWPLYGALLWAAIAAILFAPVHRRLLASLRQRRNLAALTTLAVIIVMVILPLTLVTTALVQEMAGVVARIQSGELDFRRYVQRIVEALPAWASGLLDRFGLTNLAAVQDRLSTGLMRASQFLASQAINIGQGTFGDALRPLLPAARRRSAHQPHEGGDSSPPEQQHDLFEKFTVVIRATVKGNIVVAIVQGALGGLIFAVLGIRGALLWAVLMAVLSLLPAVGAALVWLPVAVYFIASGSVWQGVVLIAYGVLVIGLVDNVLRPVLVGKDTKIPDCIVLVSTLGGIAIFGFNGFVIGPVIAAMSWPPGTSSRPRSRGAERLPAGTRCDRALPAAAGGLDLLSASATIL